MEWISVKDRLPEIGQIVVINTNLGLRLSKIIQSNRRTWVSINHILRWDYFHGCGRAIVTHWMPLPKPPNQ